MHLEGYTANAVVGDELLVIITTAERFLQCTSGLGSFVEEFGLIEDDEGWFFDEYVAGGFRAVPTAFIQVGVETQVCETLVVGQIDIGYVFYAIDFAYWIHGVCRMEEEEEGQKKEAMHF